MNNSNLSESDATIRSVNIGTMNKSTRDKIQQ